MAQLRNQIERASEYEKAVATLAKAKEQESHKRLKSVRIDEHTVILVDLDKDCEKQIQKYKELHNIR